MVEKENLVLCDLLKFKSKTNEKVYYSIIIYSSLTQDIEKVFINEQVYEFLENNKTCDLTEFFSRSYNPYTKRFNLKYTY